MSNAFHLISRFVIIIQYVIRNIPNIWYRNIILIIFFLLFTDPKQEVAFTAGVTSSSSTWNSGTLIFNSVILNVGNGYNPSTGVFTSPVAGTYVFYVTAVEYNKQYLKVDIVLNSVSKVRTIGYSDAAFQTGTNMVVLNLQKGDSVWVMYNDGTGYWTQTVPATTFTGFLIG